MSALLAQVVQLSAATLALGGLLVAALSALLALASQWGRSRAEASQQDERLRRLEAKIDALSAKLDEVREEQRELATECRVHRASGGCPAAVPQPSNGAVPHP